MKLKKVNQYATLALEMTIKYFPEDSSDGTMANAFQHAYWNSLMAFHIGEKKSKLFATAHEDYTESQLNSLGIGDISVLNLTKMDLFNNWVGRDIGVLYFYAYNNKRENVVICGWSWTIDYENPNNQLSEIVYQALFDGYLYWLR